MGVECRTCGEIRLRVLDTIHIVPGIMRIRVCPCGARLVTIEQAYANQALKRVRKLKNTIPCAKPTPVP